MKTYAYYMTERPAMPGAQPRDGLVNVVNMEDSNIKVDGKHVYSRVEYNRELAESEIRNYELIPADCEPEEE